MATVRGTSASEVLEGGSTSDIILGFQGSDTITGNGGSDTIYGGQGSDSVDFGVVPNGTFNQPGLNGSSYVVGGEGADTITSAGGTGSNTVVGGTGIPSIDGAADGADFIDLTADQGRDLVLGNDGDDEIGIGRGGATVFGGKGDDFIYDSTSNENTLNGSANDVIYGGEGQDDIEVAAFGNSSIVGGTGNAAIDVSADGADFIFINSNGTDASGNPLIANDLVLGNFGDDTILAYDQAPGGSDTLVGGEGNDFIYGGEQANNIILGNEANDVIINVLSQDGTDTLYGGMGDDTVFAGGLGTDSTPNELVYGGEGSDIIVTFGTGNDTLYGGIDSTGGSADGANYLDITNQDAGNDRIFAGSAADYVNIGASDAAATVTGGAGADTISFYNGGNGGNGDVEASAYDGTGRDAVTDFVSGTDKINNSVPVTSTAVISNPVVAPSLEDAATAAFVAGETVNGGAAGVTAVLFQTKAGGDHYLAIDNQGNGTYDPGTDLLIDLKTTATITGADFISADDPTFGNNAQAAALFK